MNETLKEIEEARKLLDLPAGWDGENALPIDVIAFNRVEEFLKKLLVNVPDLVAPEINPLLSGAFDISWRKTDGADTIRLVIMMSATNMSWYGNKSGSEETNGTQKNIYNPLLLEWISVNLKK